jgi:hypothetical protein
MDELSPPANLHEVDEIPGLRQAWHEYLSMQFDLEIHYIEGLHRTAGLAAGAPSARVQFHNPARPDIGEVVQGPRRRHAISWSGFPRVLSVRERDGELVALLTAEQLDSSRTLVFTEQGDGFEVPYRAQDEYLEWRGENDRDRLRRVIFTCEPPDYWSALAQGHPSMFFRLPTNDPPNVEKRSRGDLERVVRLYQELVSESVVADDLLFDQDLYDKDNKHPDQRERLFNRGDYNPWNRWNITDGIAHLSNPANTLGEQIELIGDASVLRATRSGQLLQAAKCLLCCGGYGEINRNSDPAIGAAVNELARQGLELSIAAPIGLYMSHLQDTGWTTPDGSPVRPEWWRVVRGAAGPPGKPGGSTAVRAVYEIPAGEHYVDEEGVEQPLLVGDLCIAGRRIEYPGQIADAVKMVMVVEAWKVAGQEPAPGIGCQPEYRCCGRAGAERILVETGEDGESAPPCQPPYQDAYPVVTESARFESGRPDRA